MHEGRQLVHRLGVEAQIDARVLVGELCHGRIISKERAAVLSRGEFRPTRRRRGIVVWRIDVPKRFEFGIDGPQLGHINEPGIRRVHQVCEPAVARDQVAGGALRRIVR